MIYPSLSSRVLWIEIAPQCRFWISAGKWARRSLLMYNLGAPLCNCQRKTRQKKERSSQNGLKSETMIVLKWSWEGPCWRRRFLFFSVVRTLTTGVSIKTKKLQPPGRPSIFDMTCGFTLWGRALEAGSLHHPSLQGRRRCEGGRNPWDFHQASDQICQDTSNKKIYCTYLIIL